MASLRQVAAGVTRLGSPIVNFYLVEDEGRLCVVDAGISGYWEQLEQAAGDLRRIDALVLTHAHPDHVGVAERLRELGKPVHAHEADRELATTGKAFGKNERSPLPYLLRHGAGWRLVAHLARNGGLKSEKIAEVTTYTDGDVLDVPGRPRVIHTPGHTSGHCSLLFEGKRVLFTGDALVAWNPLTGARGPQVPPAAVNRSSEQALASLARLEDVNADVLLFGHGEPWTQGARLAVERARSVGAT